MNPWDKPIIECRKFAIKRLIISNKPNSEYILRKDLKNGKLIVSKRKKT